MVRFRVFLGAPVSADAGTDPNAYVWQTVEAPPFPPATLDAASRRISCLYQNVIFDDESEEHGDDGPASRVTWSPTPAGNTTGAPSFLRPSGSLPRGTYDSEETGSSVAYSDASTIARFPNFQFSLHGVALLSSLYLTAKSGRGSRRVNVLLAVLDVQGPDTVRVKKGRDAGEQVSLLKLVLADDQGSVCKLTAWRDVADDWGGLGPSQAPVLTRGDVVYFENLVATWEPGTTVMLTASPYNKPIAEICYRTMPYVHQDNRFRPDLRLGQSDAVVNRVAALVRWFEDTAGLPRV